MKRLFVGSVLVALVAYFIDFNVGDYLLALAGSLVGIGLLLMQFGNHLKQ